MKAWLNDDLTNDLAGGLKQGFLIGAAVLVLVLPQGRSATSPASRTQALGAVSSAQSSRAATHIPREPDFNGESASADARRLARWVLATGDHGERVFAIIDKKDARVFVFGPDGRLQGATPVLLGYAAGDDTVSGIGQRPIAEVLPEERTTPAGRFVSEPGRNALNEDVVWVDYDAAVSMHRVRITDPKERRLDRLASPTPNDNRISYGCVNMPVAFFEGVLWPAFGAQRGIVYVLPEVKPLAAVFPALRDVPAVVDGGAPSSHK